MERVGAQAVSTGAFHRGPRTTLASACPAKARAVDGSTTPSGRSSPPAVNTKTASGPSETATTPCWDRFDLRASGRPGGIRTPSSRIKSPLLYQVELRAYSEFSNACLLRATQKVRRIAPRHHAKRNFPLRFTASRRLRTWVQVSSPLHFGAPSTVRQLHVQLARLGRVLHDELEPGRAVAPHQFGDRLLRHHPLGVGNADFKQATPLGRKGRFV